jgi:Flp pilus assembly protein TadG
MRATFRNVLQRALRGYVGRFGRSVQASVAIEFAFVAPIIVAIILATLQIAVVFIAQSYLDTVTQKAMRTVLTNNAYTLTQAQFQTEICNDIATLFNCANLIVQLGPAPTSASQIQNSLPQFNSNGTLTNPTTFSTGGQSTKMLLSVMYEFPVIGGPLGLSLASLGNGTRLISATEIFYKEPCLNSNGC